MSSYIYEVIKPEPDIPVKCFSYRYPVRYFVPAHWHNSVEMVRVEEGRMTVTIEEHQEEIGAGEYIVINSRDIHATLGEKDTIAEVLQIPYPFLKRYLHGMEKIRFVRNCSYSVNEKEYCEIGHTMHRLSVLMQEREKGFLLEFHALLFKLLQLLYTNYCEEVEEKISDQSNINRQRLTKVMDYVNTHYRERIMLDEAAALLALNKEYFCRFFRKYMGMSLLEYINEVRFSHVCEDLFHTDKNIMELLEEHGFTNYKLFMHMFRERYHGTPSQKRKESIAFIFHKK